MTTDTKTKKQLGQHWLNDAASLQAICDAAHIEPHETVLEIGPGTGALTALLLKQTKNLLALEYDESLVLDLKQKFGNVIEHGDIRKFNLNRLLSDYKIVANIPYYLSANLLRILTEANNKPAIAVLLVQKEVAGRVTAKPGDMSFISAAVQLHYDVALDRIVPAKLFTPPPKVDSQILILSRRPRPLFDVDTKKFFKVVKVGFSNRRKTLLNNLSAGFNLSKDETKQLLADSGLPLTARAQELSLGDWHTLYKFL